MSAIKLVFDPELLLSCRRISSKNLTYPYLLIYINTLTSKSFSDKQFLLTYTDPDDKATSLTIDSDATLSAALGILSQPTLVIKVSLIKEDLINASSWEMVASVPTPVSLVNISSSDPSLVNVPFNAPVAPVTSVTAASSSSDKDSSLVSNPLVTAPVSSVDSVNPSVCSVTNASMSSVTTSVCPVVCGDLCVSCDSKGKLALNEIVKENLTINTQKYEVGECVEAKYRIPQIDSLDTKWCENVWIKGYNKQDNTYHVVYHPDRRYDENLPEQAIRKKEKFVGKHKYEVGELVEARWRNTSFPYLLSETWYKNVLIRGYNKQGNIYYHVRYQTDSTFDEHLPEEAIRRTSVQDANPVAATNSTECKNHESKTASTVESIKLVPKYEIGKQMIARIPLINGPQLQKALIAGFLSSTGFYTVQIPTDERTVRIIDTVPETDILGYLIEPLLDDKNLSKKVIAALTNVFQKYSTKYGVYFMTKQDFIHYFYASATSKPVKTQICRTFYNYCRSLEGVNDGLPVLLLEDFLKFYTCAVLDCTTSVTGVWDDLFAHGYNADLKHKEIQYKISEQVYARLDPKNLQNRTEVIIVNERKEKDAIKYVVKSDINSIVSYVIPKEYIGKMKCYHRCRHCHDRFEESTDCVQNFACVCKCDGIARYSTWCV